MLDIYKTYQDRKFQYIIIDNTGLIEESDSSIFNINLNTPIQEIHPFFEMFSGLLSSSDEDFDFSCVNLEIDNSSYIVDITLKTEQNSNLIIIENLTRHYNNYQLTAQSRNESVINSQILDLENKYLLEKETFKNNFIANFSHELRNPLTASIIFGDLLSKSNLTEEQKSYLDIIQASNKDLKQKIEDILDIAKIESQKLVLNTTVFSLKSLLDDIVSSYTILATNKQLEFKHHIEDGIPDYIEGDAYRIKQVISSLLNNALHFTSEGSISLTVTLNYIRAQKANLNITVTDTGCGIAPKHHETIFERFMTIASQTHTSEGVGLGLAIVKYLITAMGGAIKVDSIVNKGTTFNCNLSLKEAHYDAKLKQELITQQLPEGQEKHHVLLIENSELMQLTILKLLATTGKFYISIASKGEDIASHIIDKSVDVILLANTIPDFSIMHITRSIRSMSKAYKKTPIIALSTQAYKKDIALFKRAGVNAVLTKPFDDTSLLNTIHNVLKQA